MPQPSTTGIDMAEPAPALDPSVRAALDKLADIVAPPPASFVPQTWGWAALAVVLALLAIWALISWLRHREANRYRVEALNELAHIERRLGEGDAVTALTALPPLLKRVALAAWPRERVASLSQARWIAFLGEMESAAPATKSPALAELLRRGNISRPGTLAGMSADDAHACLRCRQKMDRDASCIGLTILG